MPYYHMMVTVYTDPIINEIAGEMKKSPDFKKQIQDIEKKDNLFYTQSPNPFHVITHISDEALEAFYKQKGV